MDFFDKDRLVEDFFYSWPKGTSYREIANAMKYVGVDIGYSTLQKAHQGKGISLETAARMVKFIPHRQLNHYVFNYHITYNPKEILGP